MTDMIARDLQDMHEHPIAAITAALLTLLLVLSCAIGCGAILALTINIF